MIPVQTDSRFDSSWVNPINCQRCQPVSHSLPLLLVSPPLVLSILDLPRLDRSHFLALFLLALLVFPPSLSARFPSRLLLFLLSQPMDSFA